ncbi:MAG: NAD-dependent epimerase/dehydratase family protein [candidate division WWE3 bacterium]|nr:NAD-dependent epimerase/dehydratase family protein [candidate division WWE3 bacterium]
MRILITGGAGFIGSHLQDKLITLGHTVSVLDNFRSGKKENVNPKASLLEVDVRDAQGVLKAFEDFKPAVVFHLAAQNEVPYSMSHPEEDINININGMFNILEACRQTGVKKLVYSNTGGAYYGEVAEDRLPITEDEPVAHPSSFYGVSKACAEQYLKLYGTVYGLKWVALRYANVYGPRQDGNKESGIIAVFTNKMLKGERPTINGDGSHTRDYVYVDDVVKANLLALSYNQNDYFNISNGAEVTNREVYDTLAKILDIKADPIFGLARPGDVLRNVLDNTKAARLLNWQPEVSLEEGIQKTIAYYKENES